MAGTASIIVLMIEAVRTSETSVNIYLTMQQYIPEDSKLHTRRRENLKSHMYYVNVSISVLGDTVVLMTHQFTIWYSWWQLQCGMPQHPVYFSVLYPLVFKYFLIFIFCV
jgi:hypothetical protein